MSYKSLGEMEWGRSPNGERIFVVGYCKCKQKALLCESEFKELLVNAYWLLEKPTLKKFLVKRLRIPKIRVMFE